MEQWVNIEIYEGVVETSFNDFIYVLKTDQVVQNPQGIAIK